MARYIDADKLIAEYDRVHIGPAGGARKLMVDAPTADVVPRGEYDELVYKLECFLCHVTGSRLSKHTYDLRTMETVATDCINETYNDGFGEGYKECASMIFKEIEDILKIVKIPTVNADGYITPLQVGYWAIDPNDYAVLKKKYTEEK